MGQPLSNYILSFILLLFLLNIKFLFVFSTGGHQGAEEGKEGEITQHKYFFPNQSLDIFHYPTSPTLSSHTFQSCSSFRINEFECSDREKFSQQF
jgi:hypothetical protein